MTAQRRIRLCANAAQCSSSSRLQPQWNQTDDPEKAHGATNVGPSEARLGDIPFRGARRCTAQAAIRPGEHIMTTILDNTGHIRAADGSVVRLDVEMGTYVARYYRPDMSVMAVVSGSLAGVQTAMKGWTFVA
jgi:hypothetical protein